MRELHKPHGDSAWRAYDKSFRKLKETTELPWQQPIEELKGKYITLKPMSQISQPFRSKQAGRTKFCYAFNQGDKLRLTDVPLPTSVKSVEDNIQSTNVSYKQQQSPALPS